MNEQLQNLYREKLDLIAPKLYEYNSKVGYSKKATNPFLLKVPDNYNAFRNRIMVFGQETNTWCKECGDKSAFSNNITESIAVYERFYLKRGIKNYRGPFWNEMKRIIKEIEKGGNSIVIWNNINKIGRIGKGNIKEINHIQFKYFQVIRDEIKLLQPNILVFLTGSNYDFFIEKNISSFSQEKISDSLYGLKFKNGYENIIALKTNHPNRLYHLKKNRIVMPKLISEIKNACI